MGLWWLKIERPSVCYSGGGPQFTVQIHRILAGSAAEEGRIWPVAQEVKHMSINGGYGASWGSGSLKRGQITGFAWWFSASVTQHLLKRCKTSDPVTLRHFPTNRCKTLQCPPSATRRRHEKLTTYLKRSGVLHGISMTWLWINRSHLCPVCNREVHLNSKSQTTRKTG